MPRENEGIQGTRSRKEGGKKGGREKNWEGKKGGREGSRLIDHPYHCNNQTSDKRGRGGGGNRETS